MSVRKVRASTWVTLVVFVTAAVLYALTGPAADEAAEPAGAPAATEPAPTGGSTTGSSTTGG